MLTSSTAIRAAVTEEDDQNGKADRGLGGGDGEDEQREDLAFQIAVIGRKGDHVDVHGKEDQLDRHQYGDDVLPVQEDAEGAKREQHRGHGKVMVQ